MGFFDDIGRTISGGFQQAVADAEQTVHDVGAGAKWVAQQVGKDTQKQVEIVQDFEKKGGDAIIKGGSDLIGGATKLLDPSNLIMIGGLALVALITVEKIID